MNHREIEMERDCNLLELRLSSSSSLSSLALSDRNSSGKQALQQFTVFYNGAVSSLDVTEIQARAILSLAREEAGERARLPTEQGQCSRQHNLTTLPMRRSLQRFLHKRRHRTAAASPYH